MDMGALITGSGNVDHCIASRLLAGDIELTAFEIDAAACRTLADDRGGSGAGASIACQVARVPPG